MDLKEQKILQDDLNNHWYYVSKGCALIDFLKGIQIRTILDIGAGTGIFSKKLLQATGAKEAICLDTGYQVEKEDVYCGKKIHYIRNIAHSYADLVLLLDVMEHVEDDVSFLREYLEKVNRGTYFVISVPAFQCLFSTHDIFLEHYRRYTISSIESCLAAAGLTILKSRYYFLLLFPFMGMARLTTKIKNKFIPKEITRSDLKVYGKLTNQLLIRIHQLERFFFPFNRFAGMTILCLAVKE